MELESRIKIARALGEGGVESESLPQLGFLVRVMNVFWNYIAVTMVQRREYPKATELYTDFQMVKLLILSQFKKYLLFSISSLSCWPTKFVASCAEASFLGCQGT